MTRSCRPTPAAWPGSDSRPGAEAARRLGLAGEGRVDGRGHALGLGLHLRGVAVLELGQHLGAEQLERLADVLVLVVARLHHEDQLVDPRLLEARQ